MIKKSGIESPGSWLIPRCKVKSIHTLRCYLGACVGRISGWISIRFFLRRPSKNDWDFFYFFHPQKGGVLKVREITLVVCGISVWLGGKWIHGWNSTPPQHTHLRKTKGLEATKQQGCNKVQMKFICFFLAVFGAWNFRGSIGLFFFRRLDGWIRSKRETTYIDEHPYLSTTGAACQTVEPPTEVHSKTSNMRF